MARKRIKTLAAEWGVSVEDILASCKRLDLSHARSETSLLAVEEAERVKADLSARSQRIEQLRKEEVFQTKTGLTIEKRLGANVVRRRHTEHPAPTPQSADQFGDKAQAEQIPAEQTPSPVADDLAALAQQQEEPLAVEILPQPEDLAQELPPGITELPPGISALFTEESAPAGEAPSGEVPESALSEAKQPQPQQTPSVQTPLQAPAEQVAPVPETGESALTSKATERPSGVEPTTSPKPSPGATSKAETAERPQPAVAAPGARRPADAKPAARPGTGERRPSGTISALNLRTSAPRPLGPSLDDLAPKGPRILGKIDLHKTAAPQTAAPPAAATSSASHTSPAPAAPAGVAPTSAPTPSPADIELPSPPPPVKPGARALKKKRVVKKESLEAASEREMRLLRFPKKKRALPGKEQKKTTITTPKASKRLLRVAEGISVGELAHAMGVKAAEVIKQLMSLGVMATVNQWLDADTAALVADVFGYQVEKAALDADSLISEQEEAPSENAVPRPPVVTVMGHVDHGKTSLLDAIRKTNVAAEEAGGITQHIGAYTVELDGRLITFIDTPGHEAFTGMRARGAKVTDVVVLVVAADEGVMPQTEEAINHARAADVPIVVAINKIDRPDANVERVKRQLTERGLVPEEYGGDTLVVPVSARTGEGIKELLEMILLQAELLELKADPTRRAKGTVIESKLDRGRGPVATVLVQDGTLRQGDAFVCGTSYGRVRAMLDHRGQRVQEAGPSIPVEVFGLSSVPEPGVSFVVVEEEAKARQIAELRLAKQREAELQKTTRLSLEELSDRLKAGEIKELKVIVKGDTQGSVEALTQALKRLSTDEVKLVVIHSSVGGVTETDVTLAAASKAIIIGFNVRPEPKAATLAENEGVDIRLYNIIYQAIDDVRRAMEGLLTPTFREKTLGRAEVRQVFNVSGLRVAGAMVLDGKVVRGARARVVRDGTVVWDGKIASLRRFKDDVREVQAGYECGIGLENFNDVKPGDIIEVYELEAVARRLESLGREPSSELRVQ